MPHLRNRYTRKRKRIVGGKPVVPTFHVVIATSGRKTLKGMIDSLKDELKEGDALTVIFDGKNAKSKSGYLDQWTAPMKCAIRIKEQIPGLKFYGHPVLNNTIPHLEPVTSFIMFADDDDTYIKGAFNLLRGKCTDLNTMYITKMYCTRSNKIIPSNGTTSIIRNNIGKPNGVVPFKDAPKVLFGTSSYTGDYEYYKKMERKVANIVFLDDIIYTIGNEVANVNGNNNKQSGGKKKNLALIFYGRVNAYEHSLDHLNTIFHNPKFNCKVFCSLNLKKSNEYIEGFRKQFDIGDEQIHIEKTEVPEWYTNLSPEFCKNTPTDAPVSEVIPCYSSYSTIYHMYQSFRLVEKYRQKHDIDFDIVFVYRTDLLPVEKEYPIGEVEDNTIYIPKDDKKNGSNFYPDGITSLAAYGNYSVMKKFCSLVKNVKSVNHIEIMLLEYLKRMKIKIERFVYHTIVNPERKNPKYDLS